LKETASGYPTQTINVLDAMIKPARQQGTLLWHTAELRDVLLQLSASQDSTITQRTDALIDFLTKLGLEHYRTLHTKGSRSTVSVSPTTEGGQ
jgi:hypothetical protein